MEPRSEPDTEDDRVPIFERFQRSGGGRDWSRFNGQNDESLIYAIRNPAGAAEVLADLARKGLENQGVDVTADIEQLILRKKIEYTARVEGERRAQRLSPSFQRFLDAPSKHDTEKMAKNLVVSSSDLATLIFNTRRFGWRHSFIRKQFLPTHLSKSFYGGDKVTLPDDPNYKRRMQVFKERKVSTTHLFERGKKWHCFYFSYDDALAEPNHWKCGTHVHYLNNHWPNTREDVLNALDSRQVSVNSLHVRFQVR